MKLTKCNYNQEAIVFVCLFVRFLKVLVNYWVISRTGPKTERLTILRAATHETEVGDHDFCLSGHIILTPIQPVGSGRPQRESNPGPPHQESRALPTELPPPPPPPFNLSSPVWYLCYLGLTRAKPGFHRPCRRAPV